MKGKKVIISLAVAAGVVSGLAACKETEGVEQKKTYNVVFKNGDEEIDSLEVTEGEYFAIPSVEAESGYYFIGWDSDNNGEVDKVGPATADVTYVALFEALPTGSHTVTFKNGDEIVGVVLYDNNDSQIVEPQVPAKEGYQGKWQAYQLNGENLEVQPEYVLINYYVNFYDENGNRVGRDSYTVEDRNITTPQVPVKEGYTGSWEPYTLTTGDINVYPVYVANPLSIDDFVGIYNVSVDSFGDALEYVEVGFDAVIVQSYNATYGRYTGTTYYADSQDNTREYFLVENNKLNLYEIAGDSSVVARSYELQDGKLVSLIAPLSLSTWGEYQYKVDGAVVASLSIGEDGVTYSDGTNSYSAYYTTDGSTIKIKVGNEILDFNLNGNYNYQTIVAGSEGGESITKEFVKVVPSEWYGIYYYANNNPSQVIVDDTTLNQIQLVEGGFIYQGTTFVVTEKGTLNYLDYDGEIHMDEVYEAGQVVSSSPAEYVKLEEGDAIPESLYGTYRNNTNMTLIIAADGVTIYNAKANDVVYSYGTDSSGNKVEILNIDGVSCTVGADGSIQVVSSTYYPSYAGDVSNKELPDSFNALKGQAFVDANDNILSIDTDGSISYSASGYADSTYYFFSEDGKLHFFTNKIYKLVDEVVFEVVDGKIYLGNEALDVFNIQIEDILGVYLNGQDKVIVSKDGINYQNQDYALDAITTSSYSISFGDVTLVYNPDNLSLNLGEDVSYVYSPVLTLNIPESLYGTYSSSNSNIVIDASGVYIDDFVVNIDSYDASANKMVVSYIENSSLVVRELTFNDEDGSMSDDWGISYVKLPEQIIPSEWYGRYSADVEQWGEIYHYELVVSEDSISIETGSWDSSSSYMIYSNTSFKVGEYIFTYDPETKTMTFDNYGSTGTLEYVGEVEELEPELPASDTLDEVLYGKWQGQDSFGSIFVLSISDISIVLDDGYNQTEVSEYSISNVHEFVMTNDQYGINYTFVYDIETDTISFDCFGEVVTLSRVEK